MLYILLPVVWSNQNACGETCFWYESLWNLWCFIYSLVKNLKQCGLSNWYSRIIFILYCRVVMWLMMTWQHAPSVTFLPSSQNLSSKLSPNIFRRRKERSIYSKNLIWCPCNPFHFKFLYFLYCFIRYSFYFHTIKCLVVKKNNNFVQVSSELSIHVIVTCICQNFI